MPQTIPLTPDFVWDERALRYRVLATGKFVSRKVIVKALDNVITASSANIETITQSLLDGNISLVDWRSSMAREMKIIHTAAAAASKGGWAQMTQSDWGRAGQLVRQQYQYLDNFAQELASGKMPLNGRVMVRAKLYAGASHGTFEEMTRRLHQMRGYTEERRNLTPGENCFIAGTMVLTPSGLEHIETLKIGDMVVTRFGERRILRTYKRRVDKESLVVITAKDKQITCTTNHPFQTQRGWVSAGDLLPSDNVMLYENGSDRLERHIALPYSFNRIPALGEVSVSGLISRLLPGLPFDQWGETRVSMPPVTVRLKNEVPDPHINNELRFDKNASFIRNSQLFKDCVKLPFEFGRLISLKFMLSLEKLLKQFGVGFVPCRNSRSTFRGLGRIMFAHIFSGNAVNKPAMGRGGKRKPHSGGLRHNGPSSKTHLFSTPCSAFRGVILTKKRNFFGVPRNSSIALPTTSLAIAGVPSFLCPANTYKAAILRKDFPGTRLTNISGAMPNLTADVTGAFAWPVGFNSSASKAHRLVSLPNVSTLGTGEPLHFGFIRKFRHVLLSPGNSTYASIIHRSAYVYNIEVDIDNEYIANGFVVHNCNGCIEQAGQGWQPIGTLHRIGAEECRTNCRCDFEYR